MNKLKNKQAQSIVEFSFSMVILFVMVYGLTHIFQWTGVDTVKRQKTHDALMKQDAPKNPNYTSPQNSGVIEQLEPNFYRPVKMNAIFEDAL